MLALISKAC